MPGASGTTLRASVSCDGSTVTVALAGELDLATAESLRNRLLQVASSDPAPEHVVLDMSALEFLDASGI